MRARYALHVTGVCNATATAPCPARLRARALASHPAPPLALQGAGSSIDKLTQVRVYVTDIASWPAFNALYAKWAGAARPARCVVPVPQLHYGFKIEIEAVAIK